MLAGDLQSAAQIIQQGGVIAYPTEGVYGLGCDPFNEHAVAKILRLKQRAREKGLLVIASDWTQISTLTRPVTDEVLTVALEKWPGPFTFLFPCSSNAPDWITGGSDKIGLRVSAHPVVQSLCRVAGPLVSTSANISNQPSALTAQEVRDYFGSEIDFIIDAPLGGLTGATPITDVVTGKTIR